MTKNILRLYAKLFNNLNQEISIKFTSLEIQSQKISIINFLDVLLFDQSYNKKKELN